MHDRFQTPPKSPPRLWPIYALAALAIFMCVARIWQLRRDLADPFPAWMAGARRWYDNVLAALLMASVVAACDAYLRYRRRLSRDGGTAVPRPWRQRREVRFVLFVYVGTLFLDLPLAVYEAVAALNDPKRPSFVAGVQTDSVVKGVMSPLIGAAILVYDRRRVTREERIAGNQCMACGYDLRATPERCPECGAVARLRSRGDP